MCVMYPGAPSARRHHPLEPFQFAPRLRSEGAVAVLDEQLFEPSRGAGLVAAVAQDAGFKTSPASAKTDSLIYVTTGAMTSAFVMSSPGNGR